jgi:hypothetical protein
MNTEFKNRLCDQLYPSARARQHYTPDPAPRQGLIARLWRALWRLC